MKKEECLKILKERIRIDRSLRDKVESDFDKFCENECIAIETLIDLYEKQQKEIERLKENDIRKDELVANFSLRHFKDREKIRNSISKDKIREKIIELEQELEEERENGVDFTFIHEHEIDINGIIEVLHELLEEE
jgi:hypothetical protein